MAKEQAINLFDLENSYSGGGTFFADGRYRIESTKFTMFDFNGKAQEPVCSLCATLQPLNSAGKEAGEQVVQYFPLTKDFKPTKDGSGVVATGEYQTIWKKSPFYIFMENLAKAGYDMESANDDITVLEGLVAEWAKVVIPDDGYSKKAKDDDGGDKKPKRPQEVPVIVELVKGNGKAAAGKAAGKPTPAPAAGKGKGKAAKEVDPETLVGEYLESEVLTEANQGGVKKMAVRLGLGKWLVQQGHDADVVKAAQQVVNSDSFAAMLEASGWEIEKDGTIKPQE